MYHANGEQMVWMVDERQWIPMSQVLLMYSGPQAHLQTRCNDCVKFKMSCEGLLPHRMKKAANVSYKCDRCNRLLTFNKVTREVDDEELPIEKTSMASTEKPPSREAAE